jgi:hypothetical protein
MKVTVENSWSLRDGRPLRTGVTYEKAGAISFAASQSTRSRAGPAAHHGVMKRYEQPIMMAPHDKAGLIGKATPRTLSVADICQT